MTDKQIIDDVDVSGCDFYIDSKNLEFNCKQTPQSYFCKNQPNCYYKQLKRKEQECERWKKANDEKNELLIKLGCPTKATAKRKVFCLQEQLDQLKAENDLYKNAHKTEQDRRRSYENALTEIKEIAEIEIECKTYEIENDCFNETRCKALNEHIDFTKQILQKISECEVENANI